jgi:hypothetical protein
MYVLYVHTYADKLWFEGNTHEKQLILYKTSNVFFPIVKVVSTAIALVRKINSNLPPASKWYCLCM